jgi:hypothetical protein
VEQEEEVELEEERQSDSKIISLPILLHLSHFVPLSLSSLLSPPDFLNCEIEAEQASGRGN